MAQPDFDWTFEDAPVEGEARPPGDGPRPQKPGLVPPVRRARRPWPRWVWLALLGLGVAALLIGYAFTRLGWRRIEQQIAAEVAYDDARSRAREVQAVLAAQVSNDAYWQAQRTAQVLLGLPAPLPAGNLLPTADPAEVVGVQALSSNLFAATVRRRYADSAGQVVAFDLVQRYVNLAPGEWQRVATDLTGVVAATIVQGARLSATVPTNDLPWLKPALAAADGVLLEACATWQSCPDHLVLPLYFSVGPDLLSPSLPLRAAAPAATAYPLIFDFSDTPPSYPPRYVFTTPQVAGRPADAAAQAAYNRALSVQLLGVLAGAVSETGRTSSDYFLDALVARMEVRLGLSTPVTPTLSPLAFSSAETLWSLPPLRTVNVARADLADRQQALALMNVVLQDQPPTIDGALLRTVHRPGAQEFGAWLSTAFSPVAAMRAAPRWVSAAQQRLGQPVPQRDWAAAEGLALVCAGGLSVVRQGALQPVTGGPVFEPQTFYQATLFRSGGTGRYLAVDYYLPFASEAAFNRLSLWVFDLEAGGPAQFVSANGYAVGWGANDQLYYLPRPLPEEGAGSDPVLALAQYDPANGQTTAVGTNAIFTSFISWSADRRSLLFSQAGQDVSAGSPTNALTLLTLDPPAPPRLLAEAGYAPVFGPGSTATQGQAAYLLDRLDGPESGLELHVLDLASGADQLLWNSSLVGGQPLTSGGPLLWSPGGAWLTFGGFGVGYPRLFTLATATGQAREWRFASGALGSYFPLEFSADDAYLAVQGYNSANLGPFAVLDLNAAADAPVRSLNGLSLAWAPTGHTLALANALGVFLVDAATGDYQWLQPEPCAVDW